MISEKASFTSRFKLKVVNENDIRREASSLNPKKPCTFSNISTRILKISSEVCKVILQNIWNSKLLEKQYFPDNLKLANKNLVYKKKEAILVENYTILLLQNFIITFLKNNSEVTFKLYRTSFNTHYAFLSLFEK